MADDDKIVQEVELRGEQDVVDGFDRIGEAGGRAGEKLDAAFQGTAKPLGAVEAAANRAGISVDEMRARIEKNTAATNAGAAAAASMRTNLTGAARATRDAGAAADDTHKSWLRANTSGQNLATTMAVFGRLTHTREVTQLSRAIRVLSRGFEALAAPVAAVILERVAASAAKASEATSDLALKSRLTATEFSEVAAAGTALGISNEDFAKGLEGIGKLLKEGADGEKQFAAQSRQFNDKLEEGAKKSFDLSQSLHELGITGARALRNLQEQQTDLLSGGASAATQKQRALRDNLEAQEELIKRQAKETANLIDQQVALDKSIRDTRRDQQLAAAAFEESKTPLQKLGITALDSAGKLKQTPGVLLEIADKLKLLPPSLEKTRIESDLLAAGLEGRTIRALSKGADEFKRLADEGLSIRPPFTTQDTTTLLNFAIAGDKVVQALGGIKDIFGTAIAPAFTDFLLKISELLVILQPGIRSLGDTIASILRPVLNGIAAILVDVVVPAFRGLFSLLDLIAAKINQAFGTNLSSMDLFIAALLAIGAFFSSIGGVLIPALVVGLGLLSDKFKDNQLAIAVVLGLLAALALAFAPTSVAIGLLLLALGFIAAKWDLITQEASKALNAIVGFFQPVIDKAKELWDWLGRVFGRQKQVAGETGSGTTSSGFARGGSVHGPGTSTSDSILARLSRGEFVTRTAAVRKYGLDFMNAINQMRLPVSSLVRGFSMGGLVSSLAAPMGPIPRFAGGGEVVSRSSETPIILQIGGEEFSLVAREHSTAAEIAKFATKRRRNSAGRKAGYYGSGL